MTLQEVLVSNGNATRQLREMSGRSSSCRFRFWRNPRADDVPTGARLL